MTTIVGMIDETGAHLAADGRQLRHNLIVTNSVCKINEPVPGLFVAGAGDVSAIQAMIHKADWSDIAEEPTTPLLKWLVTRWIDRARDALVDSGIKTSDENAMLLGIWRGQLFIVASDLAITVMGKPGSFHAIGSGRDFAISSLAYTGRYSPKFRLEAAIRLAGENDCWTGGNVTYCFAGVPEHA